MVQLIALALLVLSQNSGAASHLKEPYDSKEHSFALLKMEQNEGLFVAKGKLRCTHDSSNRGQPCSLTFIEATSGELISVEANRRADEMTAGGEIKVIIKGKFKPGAEKLLISQSIQPSNF
jgi:hypothetical protein